jgi:hypothetical protein
MQDELRGGDEEDRASRRFNYICALPDKRRELVVTAAHRIQNMACEKGRNAILNAAQNREEMAFFFSLMNNDHERAAWVYYTDPHLFRTAEELHYFDHYAGCLYCRSFRGPRGAVVSRNQRDLSAFENALQDFFRRRDGSGRSCAAEVADRYADSSVQVTIYLEALPNEAPEFINGIMQMRMSYPVLEAAVVYNPGDGTTATVARGGRDVHDALREAFAKHLLKAPAVFGPLVPRRFYLQDLLSRRDFATDPAHGIEAVRVRRLKLIPSHPGLGALVLEAPAGQPNVSVYDLAWHSFNIPQVFTAAFAVDEATICFHVRPREGQRRAKTINVILSNPNRSNLKDLADADRILVEHYLKRWHLIEQAA